MFEFIYCKVSYLHLTYENVKIFKVKIVVLNGVI